MTTEIETDRAYMDLTPTQRAKIRYTKKAKIPDRYSRFGVADLPAVWRQACEDFVARVRTVRTDGVGLLFHGSPGTGKSTAAGATLREAIQAAPRDWLGKCWESDAWLPAYFISYPALIAMHHTSFQKDDDGQAAKDILDALYARSFREWENTRLLVLDDVGKEHAGASGYVSNVLHDLLRSRWDAGFPTIVTTNLPIEGFEAAYGEATYSFIHEGFVHVDSTGYDRRRRDG